MYKLYEIEKEEIDRIISLRGWDIPDFRPGDTLKVDIEIKEGNNKRVQSFKGLCISRKGCGINKSFMLRRTVGQDSICRSFPLYLPSLKGIEVISRGKVRRAKLYYMKNLYGKKAKIKSI